MPAARRPSTSAARTVSSADQPVRNRPVDEQADAVTAEPAAVYLLLRAVAETIEEFEQIETPWAAEALEKLKRIQLGVLDDLASLGPSLDS